MSHSGRTTTVIGDWSQTTTGAVKKTELGVSTWVKGDSHVGVTVGAQSDTFIGGKNSNTLGVTLSVAVAANFSLCLAMDYKLIGGAKIEVGSSTDLIETGVKTTECATFTVNSGSTNLNALGAISLVSPSITASSAIVIIS
jgi:hypothetical protein